MSKLLPRVALSTILPVLLSLIFITVLGLFAQDPAKSLPMNGATTDPSTHAKIGLKSPADSNLPTLFLVGDSTVRNGHADGVGGQWGWGEPLVDLFDTSRINVDNRAIGGRSSRSYIMENQWAETLAFVKPGDVILFQWGHNDDGPLDDPARREALCMASEMRQRRSRTRS
jgi:rhamnogalacturonan acetylesterase